MFLNTCLGWMKIFKNIPEGMELKKTGVPIPSGIIVGRWLFLCHCCQGELARLSVKIFHQDTLEDVALFGDG